MSSSHTKFILYVSPSVRGEDTVTTRRAKNPSRGQLVMSALRGLYPMEKHVIEGEPDQTIYVNGNRLLGHPDALKAAWDEIFGGDGRNLQFYNLNFESIAAAEFEARLTDCNPRTLKRIKIEATWSEP